MTIDAPAPQESPAPPQRPSAGRKRLWTALVVAWALVLLGLGLRSALVDAATVHDQTSIGAARGTIDDAAARLRAKAPAGWTVNDQGFADSTCELSMARDGVATVRTLTLSGPVGDESRTITALVADVYDAVVRPGEGPPEAFYFDAGGFVAVRGKITGAGTVAVDLSSGCRAR